MKYLLSILLLLFINQNKIDAQRVIKYADKKFSYTLIKDSIIIARLIDNKIIQTLIPKKQSNSLWNKYDFHIEDMNFDGYSDIRLINEANGINMKYLCWLYNPSKEIFEENKILENIISPFFDFKRKRIISAWSNNTNQFGKSIYKYENGNLLLYESREDKINSEANDSVIVIIQKRINADLITNRSVYSITEYKKKSDAVLSFR
jgi:hypothetical protein